MVSFPFSAQSRERSLPTEDMFCCEIMENSKRAAASATSFSTASTSVSSIFFFPSTVSYPSAVHFAMTVTVPGIASFVIVKTPSALIDIPLYKSPKLNSQSAIAGSVIGSLSASRTVAAKRTVFSLPISDGTETFSASEDTFTVKGTP